MKLGLISFFILHSICAFSFIRARSSFGDKLTWPGASNNIIMHIDPANNEADITEAEATSIFDAAVSEWNGNADITLLRQDGSGAQEDRNDVYFSTTTVFGASVLAVTSIKFIEATGDILEADIIINDTVDFSDVATDTDNSSFAGPFYLGDVLTHELGHVLGMGHGQNHYSTMNFTVFNGQFGISEDDKAGLKEAYPITSTGDINGTVVASDNLIAVFGARVIAVSAETGETIQEVLTEDSGAFTLKNLPLDNSYFLYISPMYEDAGAPSYFDSVAKSFCTAGTDYRGAYFRQCGNSQRGLPQGIALSSATPSVNVGLVTIRCGFDTPAAYDTVDGTRRTINIVQADDTVGGARTGFFTDSDITANSTVAILGDDTQRKMDQYQIDLSAWDIAGLGYGAKDLYLDVKIVAQGLHVGNRINIYAERTDAGYNDTFPNADFDIVERVSLNDFNGVATDTKYDTDIIARIPLDEADASKNIFNIDLIPQSLTRGIVANETDFIPSSATFKDGINHYLMILSVSEKVGTDYTLLDFKDYTPYSDNQTCMEGPNVFSTAPSVDSKSSITRTELADNELSQDSLEDVVAACGTINTDGSGTGGANAAMLLIVSMMLLVLQSQRMRLLRAKR